MRAAHHALRREALERVGAVVSVGQAWALPADDTTVARPRDPTRELEAHEAYQQILARKQKERETRAAGLMSAAYVHCWRRCSSLAARAANLAEKGWKLMWT